MRFHTRVILEADNITFCRAYIIVMYLESDIHIEYNIVNLLK